MMRFVIERERLSQTRASMELELGREPDRPTLPRQLVQRRRSVRVQVRVPPCRRRAYRFSPACRDRRSWQRTRPIRLNGQVVGRFGSTTGQRWVQLDEHRGREQVRSCGELGQQVAAVTRAQAEDADRSTCRVEHLGDAVPHDPQATRQRRVRVLIRPVPTEPVERHGSYTGSSRTAESSVPSRATAMPTSGSASSRRSRPMA